MAKIRQFFRTATSKFNATFDWFDFISGSGYEVFYASASDDSSTTTYALATQATVESNPRYVKYTLNSSSDVQLGDLDFDIEFQTPLTIEGDSFINASLACKTTISGADEAKAYIIVELYHVDTAGTETSLGTATTDTISANSASSFETSSRENIKITIAKTHFGIGEKLRFALRPHGWWVTSSSGKTATFYFDPASSLATPADSDGVANRTDLPISIPFKVDL